MADVAASFQEAVADVLTRKAVQACQQHGVADLIIGGGVAANSRLRSLAAERCAAPASGCACPGPACAPTTAPWSPRWARNWWPGASRRSPLDLPADSSLPVTEVVVR